MSDSPPAADLDDEAFIRTAYRLVLQRDPDPGGLRHWGSFLASGGWRKEMVAELVNGEEFWRLGTEPMHRRLHRARIAWISSLPGASDVIDIGGSSPTNPEGALREMGWPGTPSRLRIVDLPPDDQYHGRPVYSQAAPYITGWGGEVSYIHSRAEDLPGSDLLEGRRVDAFFMGQAIEHVEVDAVPALLAWIRDHLEPSGWFGLDTPNRAVTLLENSDGFIDPDHKIEYLVPDMERLLTDAGFQIMSRAGIMPYPRSVAQGSWEPEETYRGPLVDDDASTGYAMALVATPA